MSEKVSYSAGYTNVHELIRGASRAASSSTRDTWMRDFGRLRDYRPPCLKTLHGRDKALRQPEIALNFITSHQKWGIHGAGDSLHMLTLNRGGPVIWLSGRDDAPGAAASWTTTGSSCSAPTTPSPLAACR